MTDGPKKQRDALRSYLLKFNEEAKKLDSDLKVYELADTAAESLAKLVNAQTTAALVSFHVMMKKDIAKILDDAISSSGKNIIEQFKNQQTSNPITEENEIDKK